MWQDLLSETYQSFIHENEGSDVATLALKSKDKIGDPLFKLALEQVSARNKAKYKLPSWYKNKQLIFPSALAVEQASSEITAKFKSEEVSGNTLVDLTGGLAVDSLAFAQSFAKVYHVEIDSLKSAIARHNFKLLQQPNIECINSSAEDFISKMHESVDYFYIDPSRRVDNKKVYNLSETVPDVLSIIDKMLSKSKGVLIKASPLMDISLATSELSKVREVIVLSVENECKELLLWCHQSSTSTPQIRAVDISKRTGKSEFHFSGVDEKNLQVHFSEPKTYLYEPNAACMKAGAFNSIAQRFVCYKLHPNTHLYTSDTLIQGFPGRIFEIVANTKVSKKELKKYLETSEVNVSTRNFPISTEELKKRLGLKDGGDLYLFATTLHTGKKTLLLCKKQ